MVVDLVRTLPAVVVVCLLPGYFWAACLVGHGNLTEKLAYSAALSMTLVSATALLGVSLFGTGVTLAISLASVAVVTCLGLLVYLLAGPARRPAGPLLDLPATRFGPPALALVGLAAVLAMMSAASPALRAGLERDYLSTGAVLAVASVVAAAGISCILWNVLWSRREAGVVVGSQAGAGGASGGLRVPRRALRGLGLAVVLGIALLRGYLGPVLHDWPQLRGGDRFAHTVMADQMLWEGHYESFLVYAPGLSTLVAVVSRLSGVGPLEMFPALAPSLLVLPALACYVLAGRLWGWHAGLVAAAFAGILLVGVYRSLAEGRYPNVVSAHFLIVLTVAALISLYHQPSPRPAILTALLGSSVVLYHSVGSFYLALLLALVAILLLPYPLIRRRPEGRALFGSLVLLGGISVLYAWDTYNLQDLIGGLISGTQGGAGGEAVDVAVGSQPVRELGQSLRMVTQPVAWLALLGVILIAARLILAPITKLASVDPAPESPASGTPGRHRAPGRLPEVLSYATLLLWALVMFAGTRTVLSGFPERFERDLGLPLAVIAAPVFVALLGAALARLPKALPPAFSSVRASSPLRPSLSLLSSVSTVIALAAAGLVTAGVALQAGYNLDTAAEPGGVPEPEVVAAGEWLRAHNTGGNLVSTPWMGGGVSSRGILGMGGYTGLQAYTQERMEDPRSLPPSGLAPLEASQQILFNPTDERTRSLLQRYDVRYVVLNKRYPALPLRAFSEADSLYQEEFENRYVVIYSVNDAR